MNEKKERKVMEMLHVYAGEGRKRSQLSLGNSAEYSLKVIEADIVDLVGTIQTPAGNIEPIILKKMGDGEIGESTLPLLAGAGASRLSLQTETS